ncbi:MAG: endonuclease/exonuclease/phosphatase family protein, partial [Marmoricola sp.]|nr:endonuclease/exonuclease/phosphatase family protein [Marmoricola sp.]
GWALADNRNWDYTLGATRSASSQATRIYYKTGAWTQVDRGALLTHASINGQTTGVNVDRWVSWSKLRGTANAGTKVCVIDVHLLTNLGYYDRASANHRNIEVAQILSQLNNPNSTIKHVGTRVGAACAGTPTVIAGDFNSAQAHAPYGDMPQSTLLANKFVDTKNAAVRYNTRWDGPGTVTRWHSTWGTQIDYILARGVGGARSFKTNAASPSLTGSDHYPITTVINVPNS